MLITDEILARIFFAADIAVPNQEKLDKLAACLNIYNETGMIMSVADYEKAYPQATD